MTSVPSDSPDDYAAYMDLMKSGAVLFRNGFSGWEEIKELDLQYIPS